MELGAVQILERDVTDAEFLQLCDAERGYLIGRGSTPLARHSQSIVLIDGDTFVGCAEIELYTHASKHNGWAFLADLYLEKPYRRQGLGALMLRRIERHAARLGRANIWTCTAGYEAPGFYLRHGYQLAYTLEQHFASGHAHVGFQKRLAQPATADGDEPTLPAGLRIEHRARTDAERTRTAEGFVEHGAEFGNPRPSAERLGFVALEGESLVGCVSGLIDRVGSSYTGNFVLTNLFVERRARGQGLGPALLRAMERRLTQSGVRFVSATIAGYENPQFLRHQGYDERCQLERWYPGGYARFVMHKALPLLGPARRMQQRHADEQE